MCSRVFFHILVLYIHMTKFSGRLIHQTFGALSYWARKKQHSLNETPSLTTNNFINVDFFWLNISERQRSDVLVSLEIWSHIYIKLVYCKKILFYGHFMGGAEIYLRVLFIILVWYIYITKFQERLIRQTFGALRYWEWKKQHF